MTRRDRTIQDEVKALALERDPSSSPTIPGPRCRLPTSSRFRSACRCEAAATDSETMVSAASTHGRDAKICRRTDVLIPDLDAGSLALYHGRAVRDGAEPPWAVVVS